MTIFFFCKDWKKQSHRSKKRKNNLGTHRRLDFHHQKGRNKKIQETSSFSRKRLAVAHRQHQAKQQYQQHDKVERS